MPNQTYPCPCCGDECTVTEDDRDQEWTKCEACGALVSVETDGEDDGRGWRDRTRLHVIERGTRASVREITARNGR